MTFKIYTWSDQVCIAKCPDAARALLAPGVKQPFVRDITAPLVVALESYVGGLSIEPTRAIVFTFRHGGSEHTVQGDAEAISGLISLINDHDELVARNIGEKHRIVATASKKQVAATKAFLAGDDISGGPPIISLSPLTAKHGAAVTSMADNGFNPDEIAARINEGLSRNDQLNARLVSKILTEMRKAGKAA